MSFELILPFLRPIEPLLLDESVSEIMGNPDASWFCERDGKLCQEPNISFDAGRLRTGLEVIANQLGKKLDEDNPLLDAHLPDGSRLAAVIPPVVCPAPSLTIRKFTSRHYTVDDLIARGTLTRPLADFLAEQIRSGKTLLISGGTGTGKTTLLRILADFIPDQERLVVIEDTSELQIRKPRGSASAMENCARNRTFPSTPAGSEPALKSSPISSARSSMKTTPYWTRISRMGAALRRRFRRSYAPLRR